MFVIIFRAVSLFISAHPLFHGFTDSGGHRRFARNNGEFLLPGRLPMIQDTDNLVDTLGDYMAINPVAGLRGTMNTLRVCHCGDLSIVPGFSGIDSAAQDLGKAATGTVFTG